MPEPRLKTAQGDDNGSAQQGSEHPEDDSHHAFQNVSQVLSKLNLGNLKTHHASSSHSGREPRSNLVPQSDMQKRAVAIPLQGSGATTTPNSTERSSIPPSSLR